MGWYRNNNVAGASNNSNNCNNVAGVSEANFKVPVYSHIDGKDFCRAVNRCLDQRLAAEEENNERSNHCGCKRCREY